MPKGFTVNVNEEPVDFDVSYMPHYFVGRWRLTLFGEQVGCYRVHYDFVED